MNVFNSLRIFIIFLFTNLEFYYTLKNKKIS